MSTVSPTRRPGIYRVKTGLTSAELLEVHGYLASLLFEETKTRTRRRSS